MTQSDESRYAEHSDASESRPAPQEMAASGESGGSEGNRLLAALPRDERRRLERSLERVEATQRFIFYEPDQSISHVYFPITGVASLLMLGEGEDPDEVEVGTVGNEGMVGIPVFLGRDSTPGRALMQVPGPVLRMPVEVFRAEVVDVPGSRLQVLLQAYTHALMVQMAQGVACNRLHTIEQRAARWLLMTQDRVSGPTFSLTQEFLGQMLGVRRASVSDAASTLQDEGLIRYTRGVITVLDRSGLEARSCVCYSIIRDEFDRMFTAV